MGQMGEDWYSEGDRYRKGGTMDWKQVGSVIWKNGVGTKTEVIEVSKQLSSDRGGVLVRTTAYNTEATEISTHTLFIPDIKVAQFRN
jgi:hypothetical protein